MAHSNEQLLCAMFLWNWLCCYSFLYRNSVLKNRAIVHRTLPNPITSWGCFEIVAPKTLENIQKNVFSGVLTPDWKLLCRYLFRSAQKRKHILRFWKFPKPNVYFLLLRHGPANQNSLVQQKQIPKKEFSVGQETVYNEGI